MNNNLPINITRRLILICLPLISLQASAIKSLPAGLTESINSVLLHENFRPLDHVSEEKKLESQANSSFRAYKRINLFRGSLAVATVASGVFAMVSMSNYSMIENQISLGLSKMTPAEIELAKPELDQAYNRSVQSQFLVSALAIATLLLDLKKVKAKEKLQKQILQIESKKLAITIENLVSLDKKTSYLFLTDLKSGSSVQLITAQSNVSKGAVVKNLQKKARPGKFTNGVVFEKVESHPTSDSKKHEAKLLKTQINQKTLEPGIYLLSTQPRP